MKTLLKTLLFVGVGSLAARAQNGTSCNEAFPFCTGTTYNFPNNTDVPSLGRINCLTQTPNPVWYYMQVGTSGSINIDISQVDDFGDGIDVDFALWGPFPSPGAGCASISGNPNNSIVDCSYSSDDIEQANIGNAVAGQYYILLLTNYSNDPGSITFEQPSGPAGGTGTTNCGILAGATSNGPICQGQTLNLTATPIPGATYAWSGPAGFTSTQQNPSIPNATPANSGTYRLIAANNNGIDTAFVDVVVNPKPTASYTATPLVCQGQTVNFNASASQPVPGINSYQWSYTGGIVNQTTTVPNTTNTYNTPGTYNTRLIVSTAAGCKDTANVSVIVAPLPTAAFDMATKACEGRDVQLNASASSVAAPGTLSEYRWDFDNDGTVDQTVNTPILPHAFQDGNHTVKLTVATNAGCTANVSKSIQVFDFPQADFSYNDACVGGVTRFTNLTVPATASFAWDLGQGNLSTGTDPSVNFPGLGNYPVRLVALVGQLCADTVDKTVVITNDVTAAFSFNEPCGFDGIFTDLSSIPAGAQGTITGWTWSFGEGGSSYDRNPTYTYTQNGVYDVSLVVATAEGCFDTIVQQVPKYAIPVAAFSAPNVCLQAPTEFLDSSSVSSGQIQTRVWTFGDGDSSVLALPKHTYDTTGSYSIRLIVTTENGCSDTAYADTQVYPKPTAAFATIPENYTTLLEPDVVLADMSVGAVSWYWTVGSAGTSTEQKPIWTFISTGTYSIVLEVTNEFGCKDEVRRDFVVMPAYNFFAPNAFTPQNGDPLNTHWRVYTMGMKEIDLRIFDRWGELLYATKDPNFRWDGKYLGKNLPAGEYVYKADTRDIEGKQYQYFGTVLILQ